MIKTEEQVPISEDNNQTLDEYFGEYFFEERSGEPINKEDSIAIANILKKYVQVGTRIDIEAKFKFKKPKYGTIALYDIIIYNDDKIIGAYALLQREEGFYIHTLESIETREEGKTILGLLQTKDRVINLGNTEESVSKKLIGILFS